MAKKLGLDDRYAAVYREMEDLALSLLEYMPDGADDVEIICHKILKLNAKAKDLNSRIAMRDE